LSQNRPDHNRITLQDILDLVQEYLPGEDISILEKAYEYARKVHADKKRISGHSYMSHLLAVSYTLATMKLDLPTITAGLLHGTLKEHSVGSSSREELEDLFGEDIINLVSGNTKISKMEFNSRMAFQAENVRKMFLAMSADIRVLLVKLADRLHDMQTLNALPRHRQEEVARETMDLYAPLASRLGIDWLKRELEDLSFSFLHPAEFADLSAKISTSVSERQIYVDQIRNLLSEKLRAQNLFNFQILGRPKHLFSIYKKILAQNIPLEKIYDKVAFRIILQTVGECYEALGMVHSLWPPIPSRFKDFISTPKANMYQSLHTSVVGPNGEFMEIQIRTEDMDQIAKEGIAAHWAYKEGTNISQKDAKLFGWLKQLIQELKELKDPEEFLDTLKTELKTQEVYVVTPGGEVKELPLGSTPLDFAYAIHTEVGNRCVGAKVNSRMVQLRHELQNGDRVEIITSPNQKPSRAWLSLVKTSRARSRIRSWLNREENERSLEIGREVCERELRKHNINLKKASKHPVFKDALKALNCNTLEDLQRKVGIGKISIKAIIDILKPQAEKTKEETPEISAVPETIARPDTKKKESSGIIEIDGIDDMLVKISQCCLPVPGDNIVGFITAGRGISIHKTTCQNFLASDPQRHIDVAWSKSENSVHRARLQVTAHDKKGLLASLSKAISTEDANIVGLEAKSTDGNLAQLTMDLQVTGIDHLSRLILHLKQLEEVIEVQRN